MRYVSSVNFPFLILFNFNLLMKLFCYAVCTCYLLQNSSAMENKQKEEHLKQIEVRVLVHCWNVFSDHYQRTTGLDWFGRVTLI